MSWAKSSSACTYLLALLCLVSFLPSGRLLSIERYALKCDSALWYASLDTAIAQEGTVETGQNGGAVIKYQDAVGIRGPYCNAGLYWAFVQACKAMKKLLSEIPVLRTGLCSAGWNYAKKHGVKTRPIPERGDQIVWQLPRSPSGHTGRIKHVLPNGIVQTVEFNTSSGKLGSQRDGGGVYPRKRAYLHPLGRMTCRGFIGRQS